MITRSFFSNRGVKPTVREATQNSSHLKGRLGSIVLRLQIRLQAAVLPRLQLPELVSTGNTLNIKVLYFHFSFNTKYRSKKSLFSEEESNTFQIFLILKDRQSSKMFVSTLFSLQSSTKIVSCFKLFQSKCVPVLPIF